MKNEIHIKHYYPVSKPKLFPCKDFYKCQRTAMNSINVLSDVVPLPSTGRREAKR